MYISYDDVSAQRLTNVIWRLSNMDKAHRHRTYVDRTRYRMISLRSLVLSLSRSLAHSLAMYTHRSLQFIFDSRIHA